LIFTDTNILLRSLQTDSPHYLLTKAALEKLRERQEILCIAPQNVVEFWAVATRPISTSGMGMSTSRASMEIEYILQLFRLLPYTHDVLAIWRRVVLANNVSGKQVHDAHLVAMMHAYSITSILTFNTADFRRYPGISVISPSEL
jgi:predicted nucleic acid-binding protein